MLTPRSLRQQRTSNQANQKEFAGVNLYKFDFRDDDPKFVKIPKADPKNPQSIEPMLKLATKSLELKRPAQQLFTEDNQPITEFSQIQQDMNIYVSCTAAYQDESDQPVYKSRLPKTYAAGKKTLPLVPQPEVKPKPEAYQHIAIAASQYTVKENLRDSLLSLYNSLSPAHKSQLPCAAALQKLSDDTQQYLVEDSLLSQFIGPTTVISDTPLGQQTTQWAMEHLKGLNPEACRFSITGPSQSGKSTLLNILVSLFYQKLQISQETSHYLIFPINWQLQQIYIEDIPKLYSIIVTTTLASLRASCMRLVPVINTFQQYLTSLIEMPLLPAVPPPLQKFPGFPTTLVQQIGSQIHRAWNNPEGFEDFLNLMFLLPDNLAKCFGFNNAVYVVDHYDACCLAIEAPEKFTAQKPFSIPASFNKALNVCPFFVASLDDGEFFKYFDVDSLHLKTEYMINPDPMPDILIKDPQMTIKQSMCNGCPGYCALYKKVVNLAREAEEKMAVKEQFAKLRSVVDIARQEMLHQQVYKLCILLKEVSEEFIDAGKLTKIGELQELNITIH